MRLISILFVALAYYQAAEFSLVWSSGDAGVVTIWLPNGILLAALMLAKPGRSIELLLAGGLASFFANIHADTPLAASLGFTLANLGEVSLAHWLLRRRKVAPRDIVAGRSFWYFVLATMIAVSVSTAFALLFVADDRLRVAWSWFSTDAMGILLVTPALVLLPGFVTRAGRNQAHRLIRFAAALALVAGAAVLCFAQNDYPVFFIPMIALLPLVSRFGLIGACWGVLTIAIASSIFAARGLGPIFLIPGGSQNSTLFLQVYLMSLWFSLLPVSSLLTAQWRAKRELTQSVAQLERAESCAHVGHWRVELATQTLFWSAEVFRIHGMEPGSPPLLESAIDFYHCDDRDRVSACVEAAMTTGEPFEFVARLHCPGQDETYISSYGEAELDADGNVTAIFGMIQNITLQVEQHELLIEAREKAEETALAALKVADTDALTGIANRRSAERKGRLLLASAVARDAPLAVVLIDADHFKQVNDRHGHAVGDDVLKYIVSTAQRGLREKDLLARFGGEEFVLILPDANSEIAIRVVERIRRAIGQVRPPIDGPSVTVSAGVAQRRDGDSFEDIWKRADSALYEAKDAGRNQFKLAA